MAHIEDQISFYLKQFASLNDWAISCNQCLTLKEIISITNVVVDYVENGYSKEIGERLSTIDNYLKNEK